MKKFILIYVQAFLIVALTTLSVWLISIGNKAGAILVSGCISLLWTLNVKDLALATWRHRIVYVAGGISGTALALYSQNLFK